MGIIKLLKAKYDVKIVKAARRNRHYYFKREQY